MTSLADVHDIAVIDDDPTQAEIVGEMVVDAGFKPVLLDIEQKFSRVSQLVDLVTDRAQAAICDHRLSHGQMAQFLGAEAVAALYKRRVPAVLFTQFLDIDADVTIRRWRPWIPIVLSRQEAMEKPDLIVKGLLTCYRELRGERIPERATQRSLIRIADLRNEGEKVVDVFISNWRPLQAVRLPLSTIPEPLRAEVKPGGYLIANVNTDAERAVDLFFEDFERAPDPVEISDVLD